MAGETHTVEYKVHVAKNYDEKILGKEIFVSPDIHRVGDYGSNTIAMFGDGFTIIVEEPEK